MTTRFVLKRVSKEVNATFTGINGEVLAIPGSGIALHDGATLGGVLLEPRPLNAGRNLLRNGSFIVNQNGTSWLAIPSSGNIEYIADGWHFHRGGGTTANAATSRSFVDGQPDAYTALRVSTFSGGAPNSFAVLCQQIDDARLLGGKRVTVSFKAKASANRRIALTVRRDFRGGVSDEIFIGNFEIGVAWKSYSQTFDVPNTVAATVFTAGHFTGLWFWLEAGGDFDARTGGIGVHSGSFDVTNIKMEIGDRATPFGEISGGDELLKVQQYFEKSTETVFMSQGGYNDADTVKTVAYIPFRVPKVKAPAISAGSITADFAASPTVFDIGARGFNVLATASDVSSIARVTGYTADAEILPY